MSYDIPYAQGSTESMLNFVMVRDSSLHLKSGSGTVNDATMSAFWSSLGNIVNSGDRAYQTSTAWVSGTEKQIANVTGSGFITNIITPAGSSSTANSINIRLVIDGRESSFTFTIPSSSGTRGVGGALAQWDSTNNASQPVGIGSAMDDGFVSTSDRTLMLPSTIASMFSMGCLRYENSFQLYMTLTGSNVAGVGTILRNSAVLTSELGVLR